MRQIAKNILSILTIREKRRLFMVTALDILINILDILFLGGLLFIINFFTQKEQVSTHYHFLTAPLDQEPYLVIAFFFLLFTIKNLFGFSILKKQHHFVYDVALRISEDSLSDYLSADYRHYAHTDSSVHIRKISQQSIQFGQYVLLGLQQVTSQLVLIGVTMLAILLFNAKLLLLLLLVIVPPVLVIAWLMKRRLQSLRYRAKETSEKSMQHLFEALNGFVESNVYDKQHFFISRFSRFQKKLHHYIANQQTIQGFPTRLIEIFAILGLCVLIMLSKQTGNAGVPLLLIGAFMGAAYKIIPGIVKILNSMGQIKAYQFTITDLMQHDYAPLTVMPNRKDNISSIEFEQVGFQYQDKEILDRLNFKIYPGDFVAISGPSGKGKTTIINLLLGFLEPSSGLIRYNGHPQTKTGRLAFLPRISYAKQQPFFIHDTLIRNIVLDEEPYDQTRLEEIISITGLDRMISAYPEGCGHVLDEQGRNISGGERQRIAFARALYKSADLIILDEPFTEMDEPSELSMLEELQSLASEGRIILLITHNTSSFSYCNKTITLA